MHGGEPHGAVPRTQPTCVDTNVTELAANPAGTGPPAGPGSVVGGVEVVEPGGTEVVDPPAGVGLVDVELPVVLADLVAVEHPAAPRRRTASPTAMGPATRRRPGPVLDVTGSSVAGRSPHGTAEAARPLKVGRPRVDILTVRTTAQARRTMFGLLAMFGLGATTVLPSSGARADSATPVSVTAANAGWFDAIGFHDGASTNYYTGATGQADFHGGRVRSFFVFDLSGVSGQVVSAQLSARSYSGTGAPAMLSLYDVSTTPAALATTADAATQIFDDLGSGTVLGSAAVTDPTAATITVPLSVDGVSALQAALGGTFALGGDYAPGSTVEQDIFGSTGGGNGPGVVHPLSDVQLLLDVAPPGTTTTTTAVAPTTTTTAAALPTSTTTPPPTTAPAPTTARATTTTRAATRAAASGTSSTVARVATSTTRPRTTSSTTLAATTTTTSTATAAPTASPVPTTAAPTTTTLGPTRPTSTDGTSLVAMVTGPDGALAAAGVVVLGAFLLLRRRHTRP